MHNSLTLYEWFELTWTISGTTVSRVLVIIWKLYMSSCLIILAPMYVNIDITWCNTTSCKHRLDDQCYVKSCVRIWQTTDITSHTTPTHTHDKLPLIHKSYWICYGNKEQNIFLCAKWVMSYTGNRPKVDAGWMHHCMQVAWIRLRLFKKRCWSLQSEKRHPARSHALLTT